MCLVYVCIPFFISSLVGFFGLFFIAVFLDVCRYVCLYLVMAFGLSVFSLFVR